MRVAIILGSFPLDTPGGAEYQSYFLAQGLARLGHEVTYLALRAGGESQHWVEGFRLHRLPGPRLLGPRAHQRMLFQAIAQLAPDVCYLRSYRDLPALAQFCGEPRTPLVFCASSLWDCSPWRSSRHPREWIEHLRSFLAMRYVSHVVTVSQTQRLRLGRWFPTRPMSTIYDAGEAPLKGHPHHGTSGQVIWVNNLKKVKRPELVVRLARSLPGPRFVMIGCPASGRYGKWLQALINQGPPNLAYLGPKPIGEVNEMISGSDILLYTSRPVEGFGDSFIQAWMRGVPTVSLQFDPDGIIEREGLGRRCRTFTEMVADVRELQDRPTLRAGMGKRAREYATRHHALPTMVARYEGLFQGLWHAG